MLEFTHLSKFRDHGRQTFRGMKKKLALACAMVQIPVLILDEPSLRTLSAAVILEYPRQHRQGWRDRLISTPYMDEADRCNESECFTKAVCFAQVLLENYSEPSIETLRSKPPS